MLAISSVGLPLADIPWGMHVSADRASGDRYQGALCYISHGNSCGGCERSNVVVARRQVMNYDAVIYYRPCAEVNLVNSFEVLLVAVIWLRAAWRPKVKSVVVRDKVVLRSVRRVAICGAARGGLCYE